MPQPLGRHSHTPDWVQTLRAKGLRATPQRAAVLEFLHHHPHTDAEAIFQAVCPSLRTISLQAIHLIVQDLSGKGLIRRTSLPDSVSARYETRIEDNHHHIQCIHAGASKTWTVSSATLPALFPARRTACVLSRPVSSSAVFAMIVIPQPSKGRKSLDD
jgi:Fe2+ or Zn2+ uptake regulation protein